MKKILCNLIVIGSILLVSGCAIEKFNQPPQWSSTVVNHVRFTGLDATIPISSGNTIGIKFGWGSSVWTVIPAATNKVYSAPVSDTFKLNDGFNPLDITITEDLQTGWDGTPPMPRYPGLFVKTNSISKSK